MKIFLFGWSIFKKISRQTGFSVCRLLFVTMNTTCMKKYHNKIKMKKSDTGTRFKVFQVAAL